MRFPFGQFKGKEVEEIAKTQKGKSYLEWALDNIEFRQPGIKDEIQKHLARGYNAPVIAAPPVMAPPVATAVKTVTLESIDKKLDHITRLIIDHPYLIDA